MLTDGEVQAIVAAALADGWRRGCTCTPARELPVVAILSQGPPRVKVGVEHLEDCPLWQPRDLMNVPDDEPPDSIVTARV